MKLKKPIAIICAIMMIITANYSIYSANASRSDWLRGTIGIDSILVSNGGDRFNPVNYAKQCAILKADYVQLYLGQTWGGYFSPNETYKGILHNYYGNDDYYNEKMSTRDIPMELYEALKPYGIKMFLYIPFYPPQTLWNTVFETDSTGYPTVAAQEKWYNVLEEWGNRYGVKLAGWWFDGAGGLDIDFERANIATHAGNPDRVVSYNPGLWYDAFVSKTPLEDYSAGEASFLNIIPSSDKVGGVQLFSYAFLPKWWGAQSLPDYEAKELINYTNTFLKSGGSLMLNVLTDLDGNIQPNYIKLLAKVRDAVKGQNGLAGMIYNVNGNLKNLIINPYWALQKNRYFETFPEDVNIDQHVRNACYNADVLYADNPKATISFDFTGNAIEVLCETKESNGSFDVYIDGVFKQQATTSTTEWKFKQVVYAAEGLSTGKHTIAIRNLTGGVYLDAFTVYKLPAGITLAQVNVQ
jgi:hypothetical protein